MKKSFTIFITLALLFFATGSSHASPMLQVPTPTIPSMGYTQEGQIGVSLAIFPLSTQGAVYVHVNQFHRILGISTINNSTVHVQELQLFSDNIKKIVVAGCGNEIFVTANYEDLEHMQLFHFEIEDEILNCDVTNTFFPLAGY